MQHQVMKVAQMKPLSLLVIFFDRPAPCGPRVELHRWPLPRLTNNNKKTKQKHDRWIWLLLHDVISQKRGSEETRQMRGKR